MTDARTQNMEKRRERILEQARKLLAEGGFDALNLRDLAAASDITVPTIYNLIGSKDQVLKALIVGAYAELDEKFREHPAVPARELPAVTAKIMTDLVSSQADYYRATALASERMEGREEVFGKDGVIRTSLARIAGILCKRADEEGLLAGNIRHALLVELMVPALQLAFRDWAYRLSSLEEMRKTTLAALYLGLAADAVETYRAEINKALSAL